MKLTEHLFNIAKGTFAFSGIKTFTDGLKTQGQHLTPWGKNYLINGGFDRWDYATSQTTSGYGSDNRWINANVGSTKTHSRVASGDTERSVFNSPFFSRTAVSSVAGAGNFCQKYQRIENVTELAGKTVVISFKGKADAPKNIAIELIQHFGTGGTPSAEVLGIGSQLIPLTATWAEKSVTIQLPPIEGKTLGTDGVHTSYTALGIWFEAGSDYTTRAASLGQQSGTFDIAEIQIEEGSVATPWSPYFGIFGGEQQACERYYEILNSPQYSASDGTNNVYSMQWHTRKRVIPTVTHVANFSFTGFNSALDGFSGYVTGINNGRSITSVTASSEL